MGQVKITSRDFPTEATVEDALMALSDVDRQIATLSLASMTVRSQAIRVLSDEGNSIREIAAMMGLSKSHVARLAKENVAEWDHPEVTRIVQIAWTSPRSLSADVRVREAHSTADGADGAGRL